MFLENGKINMLRLHYLDKNIKFIVLGNYRFYQLLYKNYYLFIILIFPKE